MAASATPAPGTRGAPAPDAGATSAILTGRRRDRRAQRRGRLPPAASVIARGRTRWRPRHEHDDRAAAGPGRCRPPERRATLRALAVAESRRFARHPLFLLGAAATISSVTVEPPVEGRTDTVRAERDFRGAVPAFFLGVFGFVVAHRLTTSLRRTDEVVATTPVERRRAPPPSALPVSSRPTVGRDLDDRDAGACGGRGHRWAHTRRDAVAWFGDESAMDMLSVFSRATGPSRRSEGHSRRRCRAVGAVPWLGAGRLGLRCSRWCSYRKSSTRPAAVSPCNLFADGSLRQRPGPSSSTLHDEVTPPGTCVYAMCLCGLEPSPRCCARRTIGGD